MIYFLLIVLFLLDVCITYFLAVQGEQIHEQQETINSLITNYMEILLNKEKENKHE